MIYYNDFNVHAAKWLQGLQGFVIPSGEVSSQDMTTLDVEMLKRYRQVHLFCGIGGWPYALRLAKWPMSIPVWTASPPCQAFSTAGRKRGYEDSRDLWPHVAKYIIACRPPIVFGEQSANAINFGWLDRVRDDLSPHGYEVGAAILTGAICGAPHRRERLYWCVALPHTFSVGRQRNRDASAIHEKLQSVDEYRTLVPAKHDLWREYELARFRDGKTRRIKPGLYILVNGVSGVLESGRTIEKQSRKDLIHGFGNAIIPQVAELWIRSFLDNLSDFQGEKNAVDNP